ncbi:MAG: DoxX family protein [Bacteroides sp.]|nr:DoxX family protein [Bacteroides sp.]
MENKRRHIGIEVGVNACRFLLAVVFIFSGFVKAVDPMGSFYKIQDYLTAFGLGEWCPSYVMLLAAISLSAMELIVGIFLFLGIRRKTSTLLALLFMLFMTPLTLYLALANPVSDCGCFGDAWVLTHWQTFGKNLVLLAAVAIVSWQRMRIFRFITLKMEWIVSIYTVLYAFALAIYCLQTLPILDFRPYRIGTDIKAAMEMPEGARPTTFETYFLMEKEGVRKEFTLENYPDTTWNFVQTRTVVKEKGYEPPISDFHIVDKESGRELTDSLLEASGYTFLLLLHHVEQADDSNIDLINEIYDYSLEHGYGFLALTASGEEGIELWRDRTGAEYPFAEMDEITLKTMIRANPGLMLIKDGIILNKWNSNQLPDEYVLTDSLDRLEIGQVKPQSDLNTIARVLLWFFVPLTIVLGLDVVVVRRKKKVTKL